MTWDESRAAADGFVPFLERLVPRLIQEMKGLADGAGVDFLSIIALNVRSEISMGMMNDGCTSLAWKTDDFSVAGQNWDVSVTALGSSVSNMTAVGGSAKGTACPSTYRTAGRPTCQNQSGDRSRNFG